MVKYNIVKSINGTIGSCFGLEIIKNNNNNNEVRILTVDETEGFVYTNKKAGILHRTKNKIRNFNSLVNKMPFNFNYFLNVPFHQVYNPILLVQLVYSHYHDEK